MDLNHDQQMEHWFDPKTYHAGLSLYFVLLEIAQACVAEGNRQKAEWVLDLAYDRVPHLFSGKRQNELFKSKVSNAQATLIPRKATDAEIKAGAEVDAKGNIVTTHAAQRHWEQTYQLRPERGR